jgi:uncharacterized LabA/DUF88 family protein
VAELDRIFAVFIDYDNLLPTHKTDGILGVVTKALFQTPIGTSTSRIRCDVRVYGGWYEGTQITRMAQEVTVEIQRDFPKLIRLPVPGSAVLISVLVNAELAMALIQEPGHHLFNTYRRKGKPSNLRVESPQNVGCTDPDCILPLLAKLIRSGKCPKQGCNGGGLNLIYRHEQKIVDTMLSCDLIHAASKSHDKVILISGDDDFLPPLRTILLHGIPTVRFHPKVNSSRASFPQGGAQLLEMDL